MGLRDVRAVYVSRVVVLVDGYNCIHDAIPGFRDLSLEDAREQFVQLLESVRPPDVEIIVVFDGRASGVEIRTRSSVDVRYAPPDLTADGYLQRLVRSYRERGSEVIVATADHSLQQTVLALGGFRLPPRLLVDELRGEAGAADDRPVKRVPVEGCLSGEERAALEALRERLDRSE